MNKIFTDIRCARAYKEVCYLAIEYFNRGYSVVEVTPTSITVDKRLSHFTERKILRLESEG